MDPAFLANHLREEIDRAVNGKNRARREAERWASLTDEEKAYEKMIERNVGITLGLTFLIILSMFEYGVFHYTNAFLLIPLWILSFCCGYKKYFPLLVSLMTLCVLLIYYYSGNIKELFHSL